MSCDCVRACVGIVHALLENYEKKNILRQSEILFWSGIFSVLTHMHTVHNINTRSSDDVRSFKVSFQTAITPCAPYLLERGWNTSKPHQRSRFEHTFAEKYFLQKTILIIAILAFVIQHFAMSTIFYI